MNKKAQGKETIKTLILILVIAGIIVLLTFAIIGSLNKSKSSNFCLVSIKLAAEKKDTDQLNCERNSETLKKSDLSDETIAKKRILASISNCVNSVGYGTVNPFVSLPYNSKSNCLVCSDISFESAESINGIPLWAATNTIPGSKTDTYYKKITGKEPSTKIIEQLQSLQDYGAIKNSSNYSVLWKVDSADVWEKISENYNSENRIALINKDGSKIDYIILGDKLDEYFIVGTDFFGFVTAVDDDKKFVSSVWIVPEGFVLNKFDLKNSCETPTGEYVEGCYSSNDEGMFCYYVHN